MIGRNNVLNIRSSSAYKWTGQDGSRKGFCTFKHIDYCYRAAAYLIMRSYRRRGVFTVKQIIRTWAPDFENPTDSYIDTVCKWCRYNPTMNVSTITAVAKLLAAMECFEMGYSPAKREIALSENPQHIAEVIEKFDIKFQGS